MSAEIEWNRNDPDSYSSTAQEWRLAESWNNAARAVVEVEVAGHEHECGRLQRLNEDRCEMYVHRLQHPGLPTTPQFHGLPLSVTDEEMRRRRYISELRVRQSMRRANRRLRQQCDRMIARSWSRFYGVSSANLLIYL